MKQEKRTSENKICECGAFTNREKHLFECGKMNSRALFLHVLIQRNSPVAKSRLIKNNPKRDVSTM